MNEQKYNIQEKENLAEVGRWQAGIIHEITNPINFISAGIDSLKHNILEIRTAMRNFVAPTYDGSPPSPLPFSINKQEKLQVEELLEESRQLLASIENGTTRIRSIIQSINEFNQLNAASLEQVDIHDELAITLELLSHQINPNVTIEKAYGALPPIYCFPTLLSQAFANILANALHAIKEPGVVRLKTYIQDEFVVIKISDTGCGIPQEIMHNIFDPFFTTKCPGEGVGLGLYISNNIVWKHLGTLDAESKVGVGTEFTIKLPVHLEKLMGNNSTFSISNIQRSQIRINNKI